MCEGDKELHFNVREREREGGGEREGERGQSLHIWSSLMRFSDDLQLFFITQTIRSAV